MYGPKKPIWITLGNATIALHQAPARVMRQLIEADGKVVPQSELCPGTSNPAGSAKVMVSTVLRPALESVGAPARIESVHGKGYRLILDK